uniref:Uncharacterized protein n=1 Tax=Astyanax mexicanus TaxID=7994 RepID=A0A3B1J845_ASTMX
SNTKHKNSTLICLDFEVSSDQTSCSSIQTNRTPKQLGLFLGSDCPKCPNSPQRPKCPKCPERLKCPQRPQCPKCPKRVQEFLVCVCDALQLQSITL